MPNRATEILASISAIRIASANPLLAWVRENETIQAQHGILGRLDAYIVNRTRVQHYRCQLLHDKSTNPYGTYSIRHIVTSGHAQVGTYSLRDMSYRDKHDSRLHNCTISSYYVQAVRTERRFSLRQILVRDSYCCKI